MGVGTQRLDFAEFYRRSRDECLRTVLVSVGDQDAAQDLVAEAFARAWASWRTISTHPAPAAWVVRTALNTNISWWRRRRREVAVPDPAGVPGSVHDRATGAVDLARGDGAGPVGRGEGGDVGDLVVAGQVAYQQARGAGRARGFSLGAGRTVLSLARARAVLPLVVFVGSG